MRTLALLACVAVGAPRPESRPAPAAPAPPAGPIGQWTPVPQLPGMGRLVDTAATAARRRALLQRIGHGTVVIPAAHERDVEKDYIQDNDFRQNNTFFYFTELETQDAWLLLTARGPDSLETVLFLPPRNPGQERWRSEEHSLNSSHLVISYAVFCLKKKKKKQKYEYTRIITQHARL